LAIRIEQAALVVGIGGKTGAALYHKAALLLSAIQCIPGTESRESDRYLEVLFWGRVLSNITAAPRLAEQPGAIIKIAVD
jgi:hypothetical protein